MYIFDNKNNQFYYETLTTYDLVAIALWLPGLITIIYSGGVVGSLWNNLAWTIYVSKSIILLGMIYFIINF